VKKIKFTCSNCQAKLRVPTHLAGISAPCPKCGRKITAPTDLDCIVDDEPSARPKRRPTQQETDAAPRQAPSATAVADAPPRNPVPQADPVAPVPAAPAPAPVPAAVILPPPVFEESEPIIEETLFTPPSPPQVAVAETPAPQAPLEKTQPIHLNPMPGTLPEVKSELTGSAGDLPRLDADRVGTSDRSALDALISTSPGTPTKLHLPQAGDLNGQQSPGDFIVPTIAPVEPVLPQEPEISVPVEPAYDDAPSYLAPPEAVIPDIADLDMSAPGIPMDELGEVAPLEIAEDAFIPPPALPEPTEFAYPGEPDPLVGEVMEIPAEEPLLAPEAPAYQPPPVAEAEMVRFGEEEPARDSLGSGSMERLLSAQSQQEHMSSIQPPVSGHVTPPGDELDALFEASSPAAENQRTSGSPSLEEMFGEIPTEGGKTKNLTKVVMYSMLGAVAIITTIVVVLGINAAGGLSPQITSNQTDITPPPRISEIPPTNLTAPSITDAPAVIDPVAQDRADKNEEGIARSTTTLPGDTSRPVLIADDTPPSSIETPASQAPASIVDAPALSFDERVQQIVNGSGESTGSGNEMNIIGGESKPSPLDSLDATIADLGQSANDIVGGVADSVAGAIPGAAPSAASNYNPPSAFPAPGPGEMSDSPLGKTHDLLDAFLRAPDWQSRIPYIYQGESLRPAIEDYYKKWGVTSFERFSLQLFQMEQDTSLGGPYWVYLVSTNDLDQGYPVIVRVEDGNLKVDWEIYSEFQDQHFVEFQKGAIASPHTFRLVIERVSDYFGSDRDSFSDLDDYLVYQINPPYGDLSEYSEYAFVKKGSALADEFEAVVGLSDEPLAVIVTIEQKAFGHGVKHLEITDYVTEGWFR